MDEAHPPPPGWYSDPEMVNTQRYWNGSAWTDHRAPGSPVPTSQRRVSRGDENLMLIGWIAAIFLPLVGFIIGIVVAAKGHGGNGFGMMGLSIVVSFVVLSSV